MIYVAVCVPCRAHTHVTKRQPTAFWLFCVMRGLTVGAGDRKNGKSSSLASLRCWFHSISRMLSVTRQLVIDFSISLGGGSCHARRIPDRWKCGKKNSRVWTFTTLCVMQCTEYDYIQPPLCTVYACIPYREYSLFQQKNWREGEGAVVGCERLGEAFAAITPDGLSTAS